MKKHIYSIVLYAAVAISGLTFLSCDDQLDIVPKGMSTLETVDDLEALFNQEYMLGSLSYNDLGRICNECIGMASSVPEIISQSNTVGYANLTYDASVDRATLTTEDARYNSAYKYINYMNTIISKMDDATGDESKKARLVAEARIMRAYMHWMMVVIHAQQYDEQTADKLGGVPYVDNTNASEQKQKLSLAETYERILDDCSDDVIAQLQEHTSNVERVDKCFAYAVRAKVLMQMKRYAEALTYAQASLKINNSIEDRSTIKETYTWSVLQDNPQNLLYIGGGGIRACPTMEIISAETYALFEEGDYIISYDLMGGWNLMYGEMYSGVSNTPMYFGWNVICNQYGITSDRMYYTAAECLIRTGKTKEGLQLVDRVRAKRVENYEPFAADGLSEQEAMALLQRAKWIECIGSYENFFDCKRWNSEVNYRRTITRNLGDYGTFSIAPDSPIWTLPFPANAVRYNSSLTQNY